MKCIIYKAKGLISSIFKSIKSRVTMKRITCLFIDSVDGREVFLYRDCYGEEWMANYSRFGLRVKR